MKPASWIQLFVLISFVLVCVGCAEGPSSSKRSDSETSAAGGELQGGQAYKFRQISGTALNFDGVGPVPTAEMAGAITADEDAESSAGEFNTEAYDEIVENEFLDVLANPQSTFSIDVDTASYSNVRRILNDGSLPPAGAVRIEELVNYFDYNYPQPDSSHPFSVSIDATSCPWNEQHHLVRIALAGRQIEMERRPPCNLVFLLDVSGSMKSQDKLPLVKSAMRMLTKQLNGDDRVALVVYAGASGLVLPSTSAGEQSAIFDALDQLQAGGSTNGGQGIELAYKIARENFIDNGINRVILCTDGDFNVGVTNQSELIDLIEVSAESGVFLSLFGFGSGNLKDSTMEKLADKGNGVYGYIDTILEARRLLVDQVGATLFTIAKDVKIQVDFNPAQVAAYRLIGYENRMLATEDFDDDTKDAGEIGAGHRVTALYEIVPTGVESPARTADESRFVDTVVSEDADPDTMLVVDLRYKLPDGDTSTKFTRELKRPEITDFDEAASDFRFASTVAAFGMLLRKSDFAGSLDWDWIVETGSGSVDADPSGLRTEFVQLARKAQAIAESLQPVSR
ncbi:MAG: vWA domain-containing protein [Pirellulaceae bacterium]